MDSRIGTRSTRIAPKPLVLSQSRILLADAPLTQPSPSTSESPRANQHDPLIAKGWENAAFVGAGVVLFGIIAIIGLFSRRIEHVIILGGLLSLALIAFFLFFGH